MSQEVIVQSVTEDSTVNNAEAYMVAVYMINADSYKTVFGESWLTTIEKPYKGN